MKWLGHDWSGGTSRNNRLLLLDLHCSLWNVCHSLILSLSSSVPISNSPLSPENGFSWMSWQPSSSMSCIPLCLPSPVSGWSWMPPCPTVRSVRVIHFSLSSFKWTPRLLAWPTLWEWLWAAREKKRGGWDERCPLHPHKKRSRNKGSPEPVLFSLLDLPPPFWGGRLFSSLRRCRIRIVLTIRSYNEYRNLVEGYSLALFDGLYLISEVQKRGERIDICHAENKNEGMRLREPLLAVMICFFDGYTCWCFSSRVALPPMSLRTTGYSCNFVMTVWRYSSSVVRIWDGSNSSYRILVKRLVFPLLSAPTKHLWFVSRSFRDRVDSPEWGLRLLSCQLMTGCQLFRSFTTNRIPTFKLFLCVSFRRVFLHEIPLPCKY